MATKNADGSTNCYKCNENGFPGEKIWFNDEAKGKNTGRPIPLASPNKVNGRFVYHTHKEKGQQAGTGYGQPDDTAKAEYQTLGSSQSQDSAKEAVAEYHKEFGNEDTNIAPGQEYSIEELKQLLGEFLTAKAELIAYFNSVTPKIDTVLGYIINKSFVKGSEVK